MTLKDIQNGYEQSLNLLKQTDKKAYRVFLKELHRLDHETYSAFMACLKDNLQNEEAREAGLLEGGANYHTMVHGCIKSNGQFLRLSILPQSYNLTLETYTKNIFGVNKNYTVVISPYSSDDLKHDEEHTFVSVISNRGKKPSKVVSYTVSHEDKNFVVTKETATFEARKKTSAEENFFPGYAYTERVEEEISQPIKTIKQEKTILTEPVIGY